MPSSAPATATRLRLAVIVCAHNEQAFIHPCLRDVVAQSRPADEIVVVDNACTDRTAQIARGFSGVRVVEEPFKGLVVARAAGARACTSDILVFTDADCRPPAQWLARIERQFLARPTLVALSGGYRYYDWHLWGRLLIGAYDLTVAPLTHLFVSRVLRRGAVLYGGNFAVRRAALTAIGGFDTAIDFHGEDTNLGRRLAAIGTVALHSGCRVQTSARRFRAMGTWTVIAVYVRNFWTEILWHRPADHTHRDVREV
jgi:glycosyltransferase involved in cell wall biosynthesis